MTITQHSQDSLLEHSGFDYRPSSSDGYIGPDRCLGTLTEGTFVMVEKTESDVSWTFAFGPGLTHRFNSVASKSEFGGMIYTGPPTILATGPAIFLAAHNLPSPSTGSDFSYSEETGPVSSGETGPVSSRGNELVPPEPSKTPNDPRMPEVGIIIGASVGGTLLLCLGLFLFTVYRKRLRREMPAHIEAAEEKQERQEEDMGKPEMEDNTVDPLRLVKVELDALVIRAELEGSEVPDARGINVTKPELQGSLGVLGLVGVYVKKKAELEAPAAASETARPETLLPSPVHPQLTDIETNELAELDSCEAPGLIGSLKVPLEWI